MIEYITLTLDDDEFARACALADSLGVTVEECLRQIISRSLAKARDAATTVDISTTSDLDQTAEATDIGKGR